MNTHAPIRHRLTPSQMDALNEITKLREKRSIELFISVPASEYTDPQRFELEKKAFFEGAPVLAAPSALLPKPNMYAQVELFDMPVLLTRDKQGEVRAFANVCTHRGTILCPENEPQSGNKIVCPYHAWTFALDGRLAGVPREEVFPGLDKAKHNLRALPCLEAGGLIWVGIKRDAKLDFSEVDGELGADLDGLGMPDAFIYRQHTYHLKANWKMVQDTMLDTYHVTRLHRDSVGKYFLDLPEVSHMVGPHVRAASGRASFKVEDINEDFSVARWTSGFGYAFYPAGALVCSPRYISLCIIRPVAVDRTDVDYYMLAPEAPKDAEAEEKLRASWELMDMTFGKEDFWVSEQGQKGLASGVLDEIVVGGSEHRVQMFREILLERLEQYQRETGANG